MTIVSSTMTTLERTVTRVLSILTKTVSTVTIEWLLEKGGWLMTTNKIGKVQ